MKNLAIAFMVAMAFVSFAGCKKKGGDSIAKMEGFKNDMCACKDKACSDKVTEAMTKWSQDMAKEGGDKEAKVSEDDAKKLASITEEMTKCMTKVMMSGAPTPPPAGDKPADPAAPAAPAGDKPADPAAPAAPAGDKPADPAAPAPAK
jgi:hypothetical protein